MLALVGAPLDEGLNAGELIDLHTETLKDVDTGLVVPAGMYTIAETDGQLVYLVQHNQETQTTGGREYTVHAQAFEECILGGDVTLHEGRIPGTVVNPREIHMMFKKGYLRKRKKPGGGTALQYSPRAFPKYQSGEPNPEYKMNKVRRQHRKRMERRRAAGE